MKTLIGLAIFGVLGHSAIGTNDQDSINVQGAAQGPAIQVSVPNTDETALLEKQNDQLAQIELLQRQMAALEQNSTFILPAANKEGMTSSGSPEAQVYMEKGVEGLDSAFRLIPSLAVAWLGSFERHGLYAFVYDDPQTKAVTDNFASLVGAAIRDMAQATVNDVSRNSAS